MTKPAPDHRNDLENELGNIGSVAACLAALSMDCRDSEPALVKAIDYLGYMLRLHQEAAHDAFEALLLQANNREKVSLSMNAPDPFALGGRQDDGDARIVSLFQDWLDASLETDRHVHDPDEEYEAVLERRNDAEDEIMATPGGPVGLAIKVYLSLRIDHANWAPAAATLCDWELWERDRDYVHPVVSLLRDAAKLMPGLAELVAPIIHDDARLITADIEIRWCRGRTEPKTQKRLSLLLDRVAKTKAKTPRGEEIKARHAGSAGP